MIELSNIHKSFKTKYVTNHVIKGVSLEFTPGKFYCITGASGSGKSTLLNILTGLERADRGEVLFQGSSVGTYSAKEMTLYHRNHIGFVFQSYNLIPNLRTIENVTLTAELVADSYAPAEMLKLVGLEGKEKSFPDELSGGEQQRVCIARALVKKPKVIVCDEPTGALDSASGKQVITLLREQCDTYGKTVIFVTHNSAITPIADKVIELKDGVVIKEYENNSPQDPAQVEW